MVDNKSRCKELEKELFRVKSELEKSLKREKDLKDAETQFRLLYENSLDAMLITSPNGEVHSVNPMGCKMFGWSEEEICKGGRSLIVDEDDKDLLLALKTRSKFGHFKGELLCKRKDGTKFIGDFSNNIFIDNKGYPRTSMIIRDITDRKKAEQERLEREKKLINLIATKDKFFSIVAHDLRSPFNSILGFSELLLKEEPYFKNEDSEGYLNLIHSSAKNTLILLDNILNWAKSQTHQLNIKAQKLNLSDVVKDIIDLKNSLVKAKNISLKYTALDDVEVYADENMLKLVLRNLISNAIKFTKSQGKITVSSITRPNYAEVVISDNGIGMSPEIMNSLFDINTNTTSNGTANEKGSGLGLVLCKEFVEQLGGHIWVESEKGKGSDFRFTIPLSSEHK